MLFRILMDPNAEGGGGETPLPAEKAAEKPVEKPAAETTKATEANPESVTIKSEAWEALQAQLAELKGLKAAESKRKADEAKARQDALVKEGNHAQALKELTDKLTAKDAAFKKSYLDRELTQALSARSDLAPGAVAKILKDIREDFEVAEDNDQYKVQSSVGNQSPADFIAAYLAKPDNRLFLKAAGGSGAGSSGTNLSGDALNAANAAKLAAIADNPAAQGMLRYYQQRDDMLNKGWLPRVRPIK